MEKKKNKDERLALRISSELLQAIREAAEEEDVSLSAYVVEALKEKLKRKASNDLAKRVDTLEELLIKQVS
jgi:predicted HicB family RNase H-like nuclease